MSQFPPPPQNMGFGQPGAYGAPMPQPRTSGLAVASLVLGLLGCVPFITSLVAVILGFAGIGATRKPGVSGRGLAIAGLILGILGLLGWSGGSAIMGWMYVQSKPARDVSKQFLADLSSGKVDDAAGECLPTMPRKSVEDAAALVKTWGPLTDAKFFGFSANSSAGNATEAAVNGVAIFGSTSHNVIFKLVKQGETYKISYFNIQ